MELITTQCLWLECCNCGATYEDIWSDIQKEIPVCPHCGRSWYKNTEVYKRHGPTKKHRKFAPNREPPNISPRWRRYQKLIAYLNRFPVDEWIAHRTAWRLSKAEKINMIYVVRIAIVDTIDCILSWRGHPKYIETPWPDETEEGTVWEEINLIGADKKQHTERQAFALITLKELLELWDNSSNSGLTLGGAMALGRPGNDTTTEEYKFYKRVKNQLWAFRRKLLEK